MADGGLGRAVLVLATDSAKFFTDLDAAEKKGPELQKAFDQVGKDFKKIGDEIGSVGQELTKFVTVPVAGVIGGLAALAVSTASTGDAIAKAAREAGLSSQSYQELTFAIGQVADVTDEELTKAFGKMTIAIADAADGNRKAIDSLKALGFTQKEIAAGTITTEEAMNRFVTAMGSAKTEAEAMALAGDLVGDRVGPKLAGALRVSGGEVEKLRTQFRELGLGMSDEAIAASEAFNDELDVLTRQLGALGREIGSAVLPIIREQLIPFIRDTGIPVMKALIDRVADVIRWFGDLPRPVQVTVAAIGGLAVAAGPVLIALGSMTSAIGTVLPLLGSLGIGMKGVVSAAAGLIPALTNILTGLSALPGPIGAVSTGMLGLRGGMTGLAAAAGPITLALASIGTGFLIAKRDMDAFFARAEEQKQKLIEQATLMEAWKKITGQTGEVLMDFTRFTDEQKQKLIAMAKATEENRVAQLGFKLEIRDGTAAIRERASFTDLVARAEREFREEVAGTGKTIGQLTSMLGQNESAFAEWAKGVGLSEKSIAKLKQRITDAKKEADQFERDWIAVWKRITDPIEAAVQETERWRETLDDVAMDEFAREWNRAMQPLLILQQQIRDEMALPITWNIDVDEFEAGMRAINEGQRQVAEESERRAQESAEEWDNAIGGVAQTFQVLADIGGETMSAISQGIGVGIAGFGQLTEAAKLFAKGGLANIVAGIAASTSAMATFLDMAFRAFEAWSRAQEARHQFERRSRVQGGLERDFNRDIFRRGDVTSRGNPLPQLSDELLYRMHRQITELSNRGRGMDETTARMAATALNLTEIINELGGLTAENAEDFARRALPLFEFLRDPQSANGIIAQRELNSLIGIFAEQAERTGGLWDQAFTEIIERAKATGLEFENLTAVIDAQLGKLATATNAIVKGPIDSQIEFDRLSAIALNTFNTLIAQGKSVPEAINAIGPSIAALRDLLNEQRFAGNAALEPLLKYAEFAEATAPLLESATALNELLVAQANLGVLTAESFSLIQQQGRGAYDEIYNAAIRAGLGQEEAQHQALQAIGPMLESIIELHEKRGLAIDDETQALIDAAREEGILRERQLTTNEILDKGFDRIGQGIERMVESIERVFGTMRSESDDTVDHIERRWGNLKFEPKTLPISPGEWPDLPSAEGEVMRFARPMTRITKPGYGWLEHGDIAGMPSRTTFSRDDREIIETRLYMNDLEFMKALSEGVRLSGESLR